MAQHRFLYFVHSTRLGPYFLLTLRILLTLLFSELMILIVLVLLFRQLYLDCSNWFLRLFWQCPKLFLRFCWAFRVCSFAVACIFCPNCRLVQFFPNGLPIVTNFTQLTSVTFGFELSWPTDCVRNLLALHKTLDVLKVALSWVFWWCGAQQHWQTIPGSQKSYYFIEILDHMFQISAYSVWCALHWQTKAYCWQGWGFNCAQEKTQNHFYTEITSKVIQIIEYASGS